MNVRRKQGSAGRGVGCGRRARPLWLAVSLFVGFAGSVQAQTPPDILDPIPETPPDIPRVVLDGALRSRVLTNVTISHDGVRGRDSRGRSVTVPRGEALAIVPSLRPLGTVDAANEKPPPMLRLTDGQALPGVLSTSTVGEGDSLLWESSLLGSVSIPLERISLLILRPEARGADHLRATSSDTVLLLNGDMIDGYLEDIGASIVIEKDRKKYEIDRTRVVGMALANQPEPASGAWAWFFDGSAVAAASLELPSDRHVRITPSLEGAPTVSRKEDELRAVLFDAARVRGLADLPWAVVPQEPSRRWAPPPIVGEARHAALFAADVELPGPMSMEWTLPDRASRLATTAEMPPAARVWGDFELVLSAAGREIGRYHLNGGNPAVDINLTLGDQIPAGARLRVTVEAGPSGPIQDRVVLRRPIVLLSK